MVNVLDCVTERISAHFARVNAWVHAARTAGGVVLIHCHGGVSRAAALAIAYLIASEGLDYDQALARLRAVRPIVAPNPGFAAQLLAFQRSGNAATSLVAPERDAQDEWCDQPAASVPGHRVLPLLRSLSGTPPETAACRRCARD